jgi:hypothetical protein
VRSNEGHGPPVATCITTGTEADPHPISDIYIRHRSAAFSLRSTPFLSYSVLFRAFN